MTSGLPADLEASLLRLIDIENIDGYTCKQ
jgi:hypothetical protein